MVKQIVLLVLSAMTIETCSTKQNTVEQVRMNDVVSFDCISSFSTTEGRLECYEAEMAKPTLVLVSVDAKGVAHFKMKDFQANCAVTGFRPQVNSQDREVRIVLVPLRDPTLEADCMCKFDVGVQNKLCQTIMIIV